MLLEYIRRAMEHAHYELIEDEEPYYGEIPELPGVWATGESLEACRRNLESALEDWLLFSLMKGLPSIDHRPTTTDQRWSVVVRPSSALNH